MLWIKAERKLTTCATANFPSERIFNSLNVRLAGLAGLLVAPVLFAYSLMGVLPGLKAFAVAIIGGLGNPFGILIAGLLLGVIEFIVDIGHCKAGFEQWGAAIGLAVAGEVAAGPGPILEVSHELHPGLVQQGFQFVGDLRDQSSRSVF